MSLPSVEGLVRPARPRRDSYLADEPQQSSPPDRETRRELAKLTATYYNGIAVSIFAVGGLAPVVAALSHRDATNFPVSLTLVCGAAFGLSLVMHLFARYILHREFKR